MSHFLYHSRQLSIRVTAFVLFAVFQVACANVPADHVERTQKADVKVEVLVDDLENPWSLAFLPDGRMLVTERPGHLRIINKDGRVSAPLGGVPEVTEWGQGGLFDVVLHPDFSSNGLVYIAYAGPGAGGVGTEVARGRLQGNALVGTQVIFRMAPKSRGGRHFGGRLVFDPNGLLYVTLGDRGDRPRAQRMNDHAGSVIRITDTGRVPTDNPFTNDSRARPEIYTLGNRNLQGAALHPATGALWTHEHGPQGGDEINIIHAGTNYGWPLITYGANYGSGTKIGEGTHKDGMAQPLYYWDPSIAPSGMAFYTGKHFPKWKGNLFVGSLKFETLVRLELDGEKVVHEERILEGRLGRIRDVRQGPDGLLYLLTDETSGILARLVPASP